MDDSENKIMMNAALGIGNSPSESGTEGIDISSLHDAAILLQQNMSPAGATFRRELVSYITDPGNLVLSECDTYYNFVSELYRIGDYALGLEVCDFALNLAPGNRDMLSSAILACGQTSQWEKGEGYLKRAEAISKEKWNHRLFLCSVDFLIRKMDAYPMDEKLHLRAVKLAEDFIKQLPYDESGYSRKAEILLKRNQREEAIDVLKDAISFQQPDKQNVNSKLVSASCCCRLLQILDDSNDYDEIIHICELGLRSTAQAQPSVKIGYFVYRKALALDAKAYKEEFKRPDIIEEALKFYQTAYDLNQDPDYRRTIELRYAALRPYVQDFRPLVRRPLAVDETGYGGGTAPG